MEIHQLRYFLDLVHTQHLTQSADRLFVTPSTISHGLRLLEDELGVRLFDRIGRNLRLSESGMAFSAYAARSLQELEAGRMALADLSNLQTGSLTVGVIPTFLSSLIPRVAAQFTKTYPKVSISIEDLRADSIEKKLLDGQLDVGLAFHPAIRPEIESTILFSERLLAVFSKKHALCRQQRVTLKVLADHPLALLPTSFVTRRMIDAAFESVGVKPTISVQMESIDALINTCAAPHLATIVPERAVLQYTHLIAIPIQQPSLTRHAGILWRKQASRGTAAKEFARMLYEHVR
jgi:LysR family transcriptional regulator, cyn operon transcriptional activator